MPQHPVTATGAAGKVIIFSAPSGAGKSTIVNHLLERNPGLEFSISATSRPPRGAERDGKEYYFLPEEAFRRRIAQGDFLEWEEVYAGCFYGTLQSEVERIWNARRTVLFDVDVVGGLNIKQKFGPQALAIFIQPPSVEALRQRLEKRGTDTSAKIAERVEKAVQEMAFAERFDIIIVNDDLTTALQEAENLVAQFLKS